MLSKHTKLKALITGLVLHQLLTKDKVLETLTPKNGQASRDIICSWKLEWWTQGMLIIFLLWVTGFLKLNKMRISSGYLYSSASHIILFVSDIYMYVPVQINNVSGVITLLKLIQVLNTDSIMLRRNFIWNTLEIIWSQVNILLNSKQN